MRVLFMGTPDFAVPCLRALVDAGYEVVGVVSQPDRPHGRGRKLVPTPVAAAAMELGLPLFQPEKVSDPIFVERARDLAPDVLVVVAFGQILKKPLLSLPRLGCVNVHASLLPKYRGGSPVQHTLLNGETVTGVTTMLLDEGMDTGPMLLQQKVPIDPDDDSGDLLERLSHVGADLLLYTLPALAEGRLEPAPQDPAKATYAPNLKREDARIHWEAAAERIRNQIRAFSPKPGAWTAINEHELKVWRAALLALQEASIAGQVLEVSGEGIRVATGEGQLLLQEVQEAGKGRMDAATFARGLRLQPGDRFQ